VATKDSAWFKARKSGNGQGCVEVSFAADASVGVRDSKLGDASPILVFEASDWAAYLKGALSSVHVIVADNGSAEMRDLRRGEQGAVLRFNALEWDAFEDGKVNGEFGLALV